MIKTNPRIFIRLISLLLCIAMQLPAAVATSSIIGQSTSLHMTLYPATSTNDDIKVIDSQLSGGLDIQTASATGLSLSNARVLIENCTIKRVTIRATGWTNVEVIIRNVTISTTSLFVRSDGTMIDSRITMENTNAIGAAGDINVESAQHTTNTTLLIRNCSARYMSVFHVASELDSSTIAVSDSTTKLDLTVAKSNLLVNECNVSVTSCTSKRDLLLNGNFDGSSLHVTDSEVTTNLHIFNGKFNSEIKLAWVTAGEIHSRTGTWSRGTHFDMQYCNAKEFQFHSVSFDNVTATMAHNRFISSASATTGAVLYSLSPLQYTTHTWTNNTFTAVVNDPAFSISTAASEIGTGSHMILTNNTLSTGTSGYVLLLYANAGGRMVFDETNRITDGLVYISDRTAVLAQGEPHKLHFVNAVIRKFTWIATVLKDVDFLFDDVLDHGNFDLGSAAGSSVVSNTSIVFRQSRFEGSAFVLSIGKMYSSSILLDDVRSTAHVRLVDSAGEITNSNITMTTLNVVLKALTVGATTTSWSSCSLTLNHSSVGTTAAMQGSHSSSKLRIENTSAADLEITQGKADGTTVVVSSVTISGRIGIWHGSWLSGSSLLVSNSSLEHMYFYSAPFTDASATIEYCTVERSGLSVEYTLSTLQNSRVTYRHNTLTSTGSRAFVTAANTVAGNANLVMYNNSFEAPGSNYALLVYAKGGNFIFSDTNRITAGKFFLQDAGSGARHDIHIHSSTVATMYINGQVELVGASLRFTDVDFGGAFEVTSLILTNTVIEVVGSRVSTGHFFTTAPAVTNTTLSILESTVATGVVYAFWNTVDATDLTMKVLNSSTGQFELFQAATVATGGSIEYRNTTMSKSLMNYGNMVNGVLTIANVSAKTIDIRQHKDNTTVHVVNVKSEYLYLYSGQWKGGSHLYVIEVEMERLAVSSVQFNGANSTIRNSKFLTKTAGKRSMYFASSSLSHSTHLWENNNFDCAQGNSDAFRVGGGFLNTGSELRFINNSLRAAVGAAHALVLYVDNGGKYWFDQTRALRGKIWIDDISTVGEEAANRLHFVDSTIHGLHYEIIALDGTVVLFENVDNTDSSSVRAAAMRNSEFRFVGGTGAASASFHLSGSTGGMANVTIELRDLRIPVAVKIATDSTTFMASRLHLENVDMVDNAIKITRSTGSRTAVNSGSIAFDNVTAGNADVYGSFTNNSRLTMNGVSFNDMIVHHNKEASRVEVHNSTAMSMRVYTAIWSSTSVLIVDGNVFQRLFFHTATLTGSSEITVLRNTIEGTAVPVILQSSPLSSFATFTLKDNRLRVTSTTENAIRFDPTSRISTSAALLLSGNNITTAGANQMAIHALTSTSGRVACTGPNQLWGGRVYVIDDNSGKHVFNFINSTIVDIEVKAERLNGVVLKLRDSTCGSIDVSATSGDYWHGEVEIRDSTLTAEMVFDVGSGDVTNTAFRFSGVTFSQTSPATRKVMANSFQGMSDITFDGCSFVSNTNTQIQGTCNATIVRFENCNGGAHGLGSGGLINGGSWIARNNSNFKLAFIVPVTNGNIIVDGGTSVTLDVRKGAAITNSSIIVSGLTLASSTTSAVKFDDSVDNSCVTFTDVTVLQQAAFTSTEPYLFDGGSLHFIRCNFQVALSYTLRNVTIGMLDPTLAATITLTQTGLQAKLFVENSTGAGTVSAVGFLTNAGDVAAGTVKEKDCRIDNYFRQDLSVTSTPSSTVSYPSTPTISPTITPPITDTVSASVNPTATLTPTGSDTSSASRSVSPTASLATTRTDSHSRSVSPPDSTTTSASIVDSPSMSQMPSKSASSLPTPSVKEGSSTTRTMQVGSNTATLGPQTATLSEGATASLPSTKSQILSTSRTIPAAINHTASASHSATLSPFTCYPLGLDGPTLSAAGVLRGNRRVWANFTLRSDNIVSSNASLTSSNEWSQFTSRYAIGSVSSNWGKVLRIGTRPPHGLDVEIGPMDGGSDAAEALTLPIYEDSVVRLQLNVEANSPLFGCLPLPTVLEGVINFRGVARPVPAAVQTAVQRTAVVTMAVSSALGTPTSAMVQARTGAVTSLAVCKFAHDEPLEASVSPLGWRFGRQTGQYYRGAVAANAFLLLMLMAVLGLPLLALYDPRVPSRQLWCAMGTLHLPGVLIVPISMFMEGTATAATGLLFHGKDPFDGQIAVGAFVMLLVIVGGVAYLVVFRLGVKIVPRDTGSNQDSSVAMGSTIWGRFIKFISWLYLSDIKWKDDGHKNDGFKNHWQHLFIDYHQGKTWFFAAEMLISVICGILAGVMEESLCGILLGTTLVLLVIQAIGAVAIRPFITILETFFHITLSVLTCLGALIGAAGEWNGNDDAVAVSTFIMLAVSFLASTKVFLDIADLLRWFHTQQRKHRAGQGTRNMSPVLLSILGCWAAMQRCCSKSKEESAEPHGSNAVWKLDNMREELQEMDSRGELLITQAAVEVMPDEDDFFEALYTSDPSGEETVSDQADSLLGGPPEDPYAQPDWEDVDDDLYPSNEDEDPLFEEVVEDDDERAAMLKHHYGGRDTRLEKVHNELIAGSHQKRRGPRLLKRSSTKKIEMEAELEALLRTGVDSQAAHATVESAATANESRHDDDLDVL